MLRLVCFTLSEYLKWFNLMAKKIRITRKELLKEPDHFFSSSEKVRLFFTENRSKVILCILTVLIAVFSFYLAFAGMRFARNRKSLATTLDWIAVSLMILSGLGMWILAAIYFTDDNSQYIVLLVFGSLAVFLGYDDYKSHKDKTATGKERIAKHLTNMVGGTIAVITAVLVVNPPSAPEWIWWVLPTVLIVPVIIWWTKKVLN